MPVTFSSYRLGPGQRVSNKTVPPPWDWLLRRENELGPRRSRSQIIFAVLVPPFYVAVQAPALIVTVGCAIDELLNLITSDYTSNKTTVLNFTFSIDLRNFNSQCFFRKFKMENCPIDVQADCSPRFLHVVSCLEGAFMIQNDSSLFHYDTDLIVKTINMEI